MKIIKVWDSVTGLCTTYGDSHKKEIEEFRIDFDPETRLTKMFLRTNFEVYAFSGNQSSSKYDDVVIELEKRHNFR